MSKKIVVFGGTGGTGRELIQQGLAAGHAITAVVRDPAALGLAHPRLTVQRGDVQRDSLEPAIAGQDVVLSALGVHTRGPTSVCSDGVTRMLAAMERTGVRRILCVSAAGLADPAHLPWLHRMFVRHVLQRILKHPFADLRRMEEVLRASPLDWTIVRPPRLLSGPRTGNYRVKIGEPVPGGTTIDRADLADLILTRLDDPATFKKTVEVAR